MDGEIDYKKYDESELVDMFSRTDPRSAPVNYARAFWIFSRPPLLLCALTTRCTCGCALRYGRCIELR
jgi:hypothetical protein